MASGLPSSARQIRITGSALTSSTVKPGRTAARPLGEQPDRPVLQGLRRGGVVRRQRQRRHRAEGLPGHAERLPAGGQDAHAGRLGQHPAGQPGHRADQVLAVVQDQDQLPGGQHVGQPVQRRQDRSPDRVAASAIQTASGAPIADSTACGTSSASPTGASGTNQTPSGIWSASRAAASTASRVFPVPPGPVSDDQPGLAEQLADPVQLVVPAHEAGQLGGQVAAAGPEHPRRARRSATGPGATGPGRPRPERCPGPGGPGPGRRARWPGARRPAPGKDRRPAGSASSCRVSSYTGQRVCLPPGQVQHPHELAAQPFPQRVRGGQFLQLRRQPRAAAEGQVRLDPVFGRRQPELFQPGDGPGGERRVPDVGQGRAAPQSQRLAEQGSAAACGHQPPARRGRPGPAARTCWHRPGPGPRPAGSRRGDARPSPARPRRAAGKPGPGGRWRHRPARRRPRGRRRAAQRAPCAQRPGPAGSAGRAAADRRAAPAARPRPAAPAGQGCQYARSLLSRPRWLPGTPARQQTRQQGRQQAAQR